MRLLLHMLLLHPLQVTSISICLSVCLSVCLSILWLLFLHLHLCLIPNVSYTGKAYTYNPPCGIDPGDDPGKKISSLFKNKGVRRQISVFLLAKVPRKTWSSARPELIKNAHFPVAGNILSHFVPFFGLCFCPTSVLKIKRILKH